MTQPTHSGAGLHRPATLADLVAVPSTHTGHLISGSLHAFPRPRNLHSKAQYRLGTRLSPFDPDASGPGGPGGWLLLHEPELHPGGDALVPDLAGWRREGLDPTRFDPYPTVVPAWVCEVLSPSTETFDRGTKADSYTRHGVEWLWFIDPEERFLEVFQQDQGWRLHKRWQGNIDVSAPPFDAVTWPLGALWG
jgi:Uma2 family endonuclease